MIWLLWIVWRLLIKHFVKRWKRLGEGSRCIAESIDNAINVFNYNLLAGRSYIQLLKELRTSKKGLIKTKTVDTKLFHWCHIRHLNPTEKNHQQIKKLTTKKWDKLKTNKLKNHQQIKKSFQNFLIKNTLTFLFLKIFFTRLKQK